MRSASPAPGLASPLLRRAFTWSGVAPLGVFLAVHLVVNARVLRGEEAFLRAASAARSVPGLEALEVVLVLFPLALHAAIGAWLVATRRSAWSSTPYAPPLLRAMRATGGVALAFIVLHAIDLDGLHVGSRPEPGVDLTRLTGGLSSVWHGVPWRGVAYLVGTGAVTFHFVAGLWGAFARGVARSDPRARRVAAWAAALVGVAMWSLFADVVVLSATGARLFGAPATERESDAPCPIPEPR